MGGGKIKDATALPSDVAKGKVFYNNDGRQVGTNEYVMNLKSMTYRMGATEPVDKWTGYSFNYKDIFVQNFLFARTRSMQEQGQLYNKVLIDYNNIYGFKINGRFYPCPIQKNLPDFYHCCIDFSGQGFYSLVVTKNAIMTFDSNSSGTTPATVELIFD